MRSEGKIVIFIGVLILLMLLFAFNFNAKENKLSSSDHNFVIDTLATGLVVPWEIVFLPDETILFTERSGKVRIYRDNKLLKKPAIEIKNLESTKKMGLLGMAIHPGFPKENYIYLAYNYRQADKPFLRVARYEFKNDLLLNPEVIIEDIEASANHTGCRLLFGPGNHLYITTGDADHGSFSQDLDKLNGKILRLNDDGSIPQDNPFLDTDSSRPEIWTYGHRNTQGLAFQPGTGLLFNSEHGPTGGDEINIIEKGENYGWPVIHHKDQKQGMRSPFLEYTPSIGPSKILFYNSDIFKNMKGDLLLATLRGENIFQLRFENGMVQQRKFFQDGEYGRIRAISVGPDGFIYFSTSQVDPPEGNPQDGDDMFLRIRPEKSRKSGNFQQIAQDESVFIDRKPEGSSKLYEQLCLSCHGENGHGTDRGPSLEDDEWIYGKTEIDIAKIIRKGEINNGMPAWEGILSEKQITELTDYILDFN